MITRGLGARVLVFLLAVTGARGPHMRGEYQAGRIGPLLKGNSILNNKLSDRTFDFFTLKGFLTRFPPLSGKVHHGERLPIRM